VTSKIDVRHDARLQPLRAPGLQAQRFRAALWRVGRWVLAVVLMVAALALGFVPGLPGVPLFLVALFLIAPDFPPARRLLARIQRKIPRKFRRMIPRSLRRSRGGRA
jgi:hypothetical protein